MQMEGKLDSWAIRFDYAHHKHSAFCLHAIRSKVQNIGFDGSGVHCAVSDDYKVELDPGNVGFRLRPDLEVDDKILKIFNHRFRQQGNASKKTAAAPSSINASLAKAVAHIKHAARQLLHYIGPAN